MTLCKYRPQRTYDAQFIIEEFDANGLLKMLGERIHDLGESGEAITPYYVGAYIACNVLFGINQELFEVDKWTDFMSEFDTQLKEITEG